MPRWARYWPLGSTQDIPNSWSDILSIIKVVYFVHKWYSVCIMVSKILTIIFFADDTNVFSCDLNVKQLLDSVEKQNNNKRLPNSGSLLKDWVDCKMIKNHR